MYLLALYFFCIILQRPHNSNKRCIHIVTFDIREEPVGIGQDQTIAKFGIGEASRNVLEDDYGISVQPEKFASILLSGGDTFHMQKGAKSATSGSDGAGGPRVVSEDEGGEVGETDEELLEVMDLSEGYGIIRGRNGRQPTKVITVLRKIQVFAEVSYIPGLEGRVDAGKARQAMRALQPREAIILGNVQNEHVKALAETARTVATGSKNVLTPSDGETVEIEVGRPAYSVRLIDTPYQEDTEAPPLPPVEFLESKLGVCTVSGVDCVATGDTVKANNSLVLAPRPPPSTKPSVYVSDGEVLLTDVRAELIAVGLSAEYSTAAGYTQLVVNNTIVVRKDNQSGRMQMEGPLCEDFFAVRSVLCAQYLVV